MSVDRRLFLGVYIFTNDKKVQKKETNRYCSSQTCSNKSEQKNNKFCPTCGSEITRTTKIVEVYDKAEMLLNTEDLFEGIFYPAQNCGPIYPDHSILLPNLRVFNLLDEVESHILNITDFDTLDIQVEIHKFTVEYEEQIARLKELGIDFEFCFGFIQHFY